MPQATEISLLAEAIKFIGDVGVLGLLILIIYGGIKQKWVYGWQYREIVADRDEWKQIALRGTALAEQATHVASEKAPGATRL